ncbi:MAG: DUF2071 domain-containing protein [Leptospira sp.]|nr:DUF2071 domain-containing protein [Leptospira sp.]
MNDSSPRPVFLTAEWRKLIVANYEIDSTLLEKYLPRGIELDPYNDKNWVSLVGFLFLNTKVMGFRLPFHENFEEFNLRFYVRYKSLEGWRRGVVFIKEIVPKLAVSLTANIVYKEPYVCMPMKHEISVNPENSSIKVCYEFKNSMNWNHIQVEADTLKYDLKSESMEEFILEHYWGYNRYSESKTMEYAVEHPRWQAYKVNNHSIDIDIESLYGKEFVPYLQRTPDSIFLAEGSEVIVRKGTKILS